MIFGLLPKLHGRWLAEKALFELTLIDIFSYY